MAGEGGREREEGGGRREEGGGRREEGGGRGQRGQQPNMDLIAQNKRASERKPAAHLIPISPS